MSFAEKRTNKTGHVEYFWLCKCSCGKTLLVRAQALKSGNTASCGCYRRWLRTKNNTTHGLTNTKLYRVWQGIKDRCYRENCKGFKNYGGRGIRMDDRWRISFQSFYEWAIANGYREGLTIERVDNNGNYEPNNCKFIPRSQQSRNRRSCRYIKYNGEIDTLSGWCRRYHIDRECVRSKGRLIGDENALAYYIERKVGAL